MTPLEGRTSLLSMIEDCPLSDAEICRRAGVGTNTISNLRTYPKRSLMWPTVRALIEAMGHRIYVD